MRQCNFAMTLVRDKPSNSSTTLLSLGEFIGLQWKCSNLVQLWWKCMPAIWMLYMCSGCRFAPYGVFEHCWVGTQFGRLELPVPSSVRKIQSEIGCGNEIGFSIFLRIGMEPKLESHFLKNQNWNTSTLIWWLMHILFICAWSWQVPGANNVGIW